MIERLIGLVLGAIVVIAFVTAPAAITNDTEVEITQDTVVCIEWEDAVGYAETWIELEEALELDPGVSTSCGIFLGEVNGRVYIAMDRSSDDLYAGISSIPTGWVISTEEKK